MKYQGSPICKAQERHCLLLYPFFRDHPRDISQPSWSMCSVPGTMVRAEDTGDVTRLTSGKQRSAEQSEWVSKQVLPQNPVTLKNTIQK